MAPPAKQAAYEPPRMKRPLSLAIQGEYGLNMGEAWWMDLREMLFWSPEKMPGGRDLHTRIDFHEGLMLDVTLRCPESQPPMRYRSGYLHTGLWIAKDAQTEAKARARLREMNPVVLTPEYQSPRLPAAPVSHAARPIAEKKEPSEADRMKAQLAEQAAEIHGSYTKRFRRFRWAVGAAAVSGVLLGIVLGQAADDFRSARLAAWRLAPEKVVANGWLHGAHLSGQDFNKAKLAGVDLNGADLRAATFIEADVHGAGFSGARLDHIDFTKSNLAGADLSGAALWGASFHEADLRGARVATSTVGADFTGAQFDAATLWGDGGPAVGALGPAGHCAETKLSAVNAAHAVLDGIDLRSAGLEKANLEGVHLDKADVRAASFGGANLKGASLVGVDGGAADFTGADLSGVVLDGALLEGATLKNVVANGAHGKGLKLARADLSGADLTGVVFEESDLIGAKLMGAIMTDAAFRSVVLLGADLSGAHLERTRFDSSIAGVNTRLPGGGAAGMGLVMLAPNALVGGMSLPGAMLDQIDLHGVQAHGANLAGATLTSANFAAGDLSEANLTKANLTGAVLSRANLKGADFMGANLEGASLAGADLAGARLCGANLKNTAIGGTKFVGAIGCASTVWPVAGRPPVGVKFQ